MGQVTHSEEGCQPMAWTPKVCLKKRSTEENQCHAVELRMVAHMHVAAPDQVIVTHVMEQKFVEQRSIYIHQQMVQSSAMG